MTDVYRPDDSTPGEQPNVIIAMRDLGAAQDQARQQGMMVDEPPPALRPDQLAELANDPGPLRTDRDPTSPRDPREEKMMDDLRAHRERTGEAINQRSALVEVRAPKSDRVYKDAREAARDYTFSRQYNTAANLLTAYPNLHPDHATAIAQGGEPLPTDPGLVDDKGNRLEPMGRKLGPEDRQLTLREAARFVGNARELDAAAAERQWLEQRQVQEQQAALEAHQRAVAAQAHPVQRPAAPTPTPAPQQPHPVIQHLANLERSLQIEREVLRRSPAEQKELDYQGRCIDWAQKSAQKNQRAMADPDKYPQAMKDLQQVQKGYVAAP